ncbi:ABC transporter ATP-binding protein [Alicyclobacillus vulcanalis]|uniref:Carnitine transport ATP-binding protein OpuCA n=1 Tax=Alicyclobacillus vulcanalis TaxID=252246 RepID=A0A1N7MBF9_9BACL|nr:ABC transporter ATP-binding protein [Alicyclobacillus vulcanalis]SIS83434.1 iron(III) transport system ATP-binding protein [Alicyclobacillus vulcanalis]
MNTNDVHRLSISGVTVAHGAEVVVKRATLTVRAGEMVALVGPSGSGKSTLLGAIAGFYPVQAGAIWVGEELVASPTLSLPPERRRIGVVFQSHALWPQWMVVDNVAYPLRRRGMARPAARREAEMMLAAIGMDAFAARYPSELSGGQRQRVGLARALAARPDLYLFDEPTASLDPANREAFMQEVRERIRTTQAGALYVSHQADEALSLAHRVAVMMQGEILQVGAPAEVYECPRTAEIARLLGPAACATGVVHAVDARGWARVQIADSEQTIRLSSLHREVDHGRVSLMMRPEWCELTDDEASLPCRVVRVQYVGHRTLYELESLAGRLLASHTGPPQYQEGERVGWKVRRASVLER